MKISYSRLKRLSLVILRALWLLFCHGSRGTSTKLNMEIKGAITFGSGSGAFNPLTGACLGSLLFFLDFHDYGVYIPQFLSLWLLLLGYLVFKSGFLPRILGILLIIGGLGFVIDSVTFILFPDFDVTISLVTFFGELIFALWLLIKGVNVEEWEKRALESA